MDIRAKVVLVAKANELEKNRTNTHNTRVVGFTCDEDVMFQVYIDIIYSHTIFFGKYNKINTKNVNKISMRTYTTHYNYRV